MKVAEEKVEGLKRSYTVSIPANEIAQKIELRLVEVSKDARFPGFRPGKAPLQVVRQRYGDSVKGEVLETSINESSRNLMTERGLRPALQPKVEIKEFAEDKGLDYTIHFEVLPDITPVDFKTITVERMKVEPREQDVEEAVKRLAEMRKPLKKVETKRAAKLGDTLVIDFDGTVDGKRRDGMKGEGLKLELGSHTFIDTFEDQLVGAKVGDEKVVKVRFPDDYGAKELQGVQAEFAVKVNELHEPGEVELNDELAKGFGMESLEKLKEQIKQGLTEEYKQVTRLRAKRVLLDQLAEKHSFEVPPGMVDFEFQSIWQQREQQGPDPEEKGSTEDEIKAEYRDIAERRVRLGLLLAEVGRKQNIDVTQDELRRAVVSRAREFPGQEQQVFEFYTKNQDALNSLRAPIFEDKVVDYIFELITVSEKPATVDDLKAADEADAAGESKPAKKAKKK